MLSLSWALSVAASAPESPPSDAIDFDRQIRPVLSDKCFRCHGPDAESRQADLRLDRRADVPEHVIVPGKPDESELVARITSDDEAEQMPPPESHLRLSDEDKTLIRQWISEGAEYAEHWAFRPLPSRVAVPSVADSAWPRRPLDSFVLARLETEKLRPTPQADRLRLLRRITLDLTGLPPTVDDILQFERDAEIDLDAAYEQAVDRLLASSSYGEHMATPWLDAARYADSYGYQSDQLNTQWPYRDWVIRAFNSNLPYAEFRTWQLAGDLVEKPTRDQVLATAFNRIHRMTNEGGSLAEEWLVENTADRVHTFGTTMLGLTLECCRCHDHKYDPIAARDYYSMFAFFNSIDENGMYDNAAKVPSPSLLIPTDEQELQLYAARNQIVANEDALAITVKEGEPRFEAWLAAEANESEATGLIGYFTFDGDLDSIANEAPNQTNFGKATGLTSVDGVRGRAVHLDGDRGVVFSDFFKIDRWDCFSLDFWLRDPTRNPQPVVLLHRTNGTDVGYNGFDMMLASGFVEARVYRVWPGNGIGVRSLEPVADDEWRHLAVTYDGSSTASGLRLYLNGRELPTAVLRDRIYKRVGVPAHGEGNFTLGERFRDRGFKDGELDELRMFDRALSQLEIDQLHDGQSLATALADVASNRDALWDYYISAIDSEARQLRAKLLEARRKLVEIEDKVQEVPVMEELPEPRPAYVLARGAYDAPKTEDNRVGRDTFKETLIPFPNDAPRNRLGLARWMTDPNHPLTARVFVNRMWANFFGRGLVATPENFGRQGALPTHPELLDWLSRDFVDHGWDVKRLCREIVLSATYRQDSRLRPELRDRDPENQWLARGPSRRLLAEHIRDVALAASGLLNPEMGGPPVAPYQPGEDLWREANEMSPAFQQSTGESLYRRSIYSVWKRTAPLPNMTAFDATTREVCVVSRSRTNTPLQALVLLNDVQFVEAARALASDVARDNESARDQIGAAFMRLTGRRPDPAETELLDQVYHEQRELFADGGEQNASAFVQLGDSKPDEAIPPADLAALAATCQVILNLDATIYER